MNVQAKPPHENRFPKLAFLWLRRALGLVLALVLIGFGYEQWARREILRSSPPPGDLVVVDGGMVHVVTQGGQQQAPLVVFESGLATPGTVAWRAVAAEVAKFAPTLCYDRPGLLYSSPATPMRSSRQIAAELRRLLLALGQGAPVILVAQSIGGHHIRVFANDYPDAVCGMVLVDVPHPDEYSLPKTPGNFVSDRPFWKEPVYRFASATGVLRLMADSDEPDAAHRPQMAAALFAETNAVEQCFRDVQQTRDLQDLPLVVITARRIAEDHPIAMTNEHRHRLQATLPDISTNSQHIIAERSGHRVHESEPELIVEAIRAVLDSVETGQPLKIK